MIGAIFTNSYIRIHRTEDWIQKKKDRYESFGVTLDGSDISTMSIFEEMKRDFERAKSTGNELIFVIFCGWVWFAWM